MKKILALCLALLLMFSLLAACGSSDDQSSSGQQGGGEAQTGGDDSGGSQTSQGDTGGGGAVDITWYRTGLNMTAITYYNDALWVQELAARTNVNLNIQGPASGDDYNTAVNILLASRDLPDLLYWDWNNYNGGVAGAISDGVIVDVGANPEYRAMAPNWFGMIDGNDDFRRAVTLEDGTSALFCHVEEDLARGAYAGYAIRKDWLDTLGLSVPTTIDELYTCLRAFKDNGELLNGGSSEIWPLSDNNWGGVVTRDYLISAWGIINKGFYVSPDDGKITYMTEFRNGEPYVDFVRTMNKWYEEGLIDPEAFTQDNDLKTAKVTSNSVGFIFLFPAWFGEYTDGVEMFDPSLAGQVNWYGMVPLKGSDGIAYTPNEALTRWAAPNEGSCVVTTAEEAGKMEPILNMINYMYSDEGTELINWGVEGVSFERDAEGNRQWTDLVTNDPEYTFGDNVFRYALPTWGSWPKKMSYEAWASIELVTEQARVAHVNYAQGDTRLIPPLLLFSREDAEELNGIVTNVNTAIDEYFVNAVYGIRPVDDIYNVIEEIRGMGIQRAIEIHQKAYDNYMNK